MLSQPQRRGNGGTGAAGNNRMIVWQTMTKLAA